MRRIWNNPLSLLGLEYCLPWLLVTRGHCHDALTMRSRMGKQAGGTQLHCSLWHQEAKALLVKFLDFPDWLTSCRAGWVSEHSSRRAGGMTSATKQRTCQASLIAQRVKNLPAMQETWVQSLVREDPLEKEMAIQSAFLPGESHGQRSLAGYSLWDDKVSDKTEQLSMRRGPCQTATASSPVS